MVISEPTLCRFLAASNHILPLANLSAPCPPQDPAKRCARRRPGTTHSAIVLPARLSGGNHMVNRTLFRATCLVVAILALGLAICFGGALLNFRSPRISAHKAVHHCICGIPIIRPARVQTFRNRFFQIPHQEINNRTLSSIFMCMRRSPPSSTHVVHGVYALFSMLCSHRRE